MGSVPEAVLLLPVPEAVSLLQSVLSPVQTGLRGTRETRWLPHLLSESEPSQEATSPLAGKVPGCLEHEMGLPHKQCHFCMSQKLCSFCSPHSHLCRLVSEGSRNQDGSPRLCCNPFLGLKFSMISLHGFFKISSLKAKL